MINKMALVSDTCSWYIWCVIGLVCVGLSFDVITSNNLYGAVYNQQPGNCKVVPFEGCEDAIVLPNNQAIITTGTRMWHLEQVLGGPKGALYVLDMISPFKDPVKLKINEEYVAEYGTDFNPHASTYWIDGDTIYLYVICHKRSHDSIEVFVYDPDHLSLTYNHSVAHGLLYGINNLVAVGLHEVYVTSTFYFTNPILLMSEKLFRLPLMNIVYANTISGDVKVAVSRMRSPNGINRSRNNKYVYVANSLGGEIIAYTRNADNTLSFVESFTVPMSADNLSVDEDSGDIWLSVLHKPLECYKHYENFSVPVPSEILHISVSEDDPSPFKGSRVERVFESDGTDGRVNGISTGLYHNGTLLVTTMFTGMMVCDLPHLMV